MSGAKLTEICNSSGESNIQHIIKIKFKEVSIVIGKKIPTHVVIKLPGNSFQL